MATMQQQIPAPYPADDIFIIRCNPMDCIPEERFIEARQDVFKSGYGCPNNRTDSFANYYNDVKQRYGDAPEFKLVRNTNPRAIYVILSYPFKGGPFIFKFTLSDEIKMTYESMLYANTIAMQQLDIENIPATHSIEELVYNGGSLIEIYADYVVCQFDCDS
jgi:hypothetical protein